MLDHVSRRPHHWTFPFALGVAGPDAPCDRVRPSALIVSDDEATARYLAESCAGVVSRTHRAASTDAPRIGDAFASLEPSDVILFVTRDRLLVMNKGDDDAGCPVCLRLGRMAHGTEQETAAFRKGIVCDSAPPELLSDMARAIAPILVGIVSRQAASGDGDGRGAGPGLRRSAFSIDLVSGEITPFATMADATCAWCAPAASGAVPFAIGAISKTAPRSLRHASLSELALPADALVNPICGPLGPAVYHARDGAYCTSARGEFREASIRRSAAIGWFGLASRPADCATAGMLEGLERRAGLGIAGRRTFGAFDRLGPEAVHPGRLGVYEDAAYDADPTLTRFAPDREIEWVEGWSVGSGERRLVPRDYCFYGRPGIINGNSSGCATGSAPGEALLHGLLELIERDAFVLHWLARIAPPRIANRSVTDTASRAMIARIEEAGGTVILLDVRLDLQIPVVVAAIVDRRGEYGGFALASGASLLPEEAVRKAVFEVAVNFETFPTRSEHAAKGPLGGALADYRLVRFLDDHPMMFGLPGAIPLASFLISSGVERGFAETYASWEAAGPVRDTVDGDLHRLLGILQRAGHGETIAVEQTTSVQHRLGLSTVRAIVPGLLPIDFGYGKCRAATLPRLRELPLGLGLGDRLLEAADINRVPHPYP